jgi:hypothetical protein
MKAAVLTLVVFAAACGTSPTGVPEPEAARTDIVLLRNSMLDVLDPGEEKVKKDLPPACDNDNFLKNAPIQAIQQVCNLVAQK